MWDDVIVMVTISITLVLTVFACLMMFVSVQFCVLALGSIWEGKMLAHHWVIFGLAFGGAMFVYQDALCFSCGVG